MNNPSIDLMIRLKNGYLAHRATIDSPYSKFREMILKKLKDLGYVQDFTVEGDKIKTLNITLLYTDGEGAMSDVKVYSKPGRRWYAGVAELQKRSIGVTLISTSTGILTEKEAKEKNISGELLFSVW